MDPLETQVISFLVGPGQGSPSAYGSARKRIEGSRKSFVILGGGAHGRGHRPGAGPRDAHRRRCARRGLRGRDAPRLPRARRARGPRAEPAVRRRRGGGAGRLRGVGHHHSRPLARDGAATRGGELRASTSKCAVGWHTRDHGLNSHSSSWSASRHHCNARRSSSFMELHRRRCCLTQNRK